MKSGKNKSDEEQRPLRPHGNVEIRPDLQDASKGKDLSYLNEMPQMGRYEGVKAGVPPPKESKNDDQSMADES